MSAPNHQHHPAIRLPLSLSIIFGSFTLGFYVAIQGPTLMDLIDLLHVNNDIMSHSLAFASLAYSVGGLLSGFLFNYVDRQILIPGYYVVFGVSNIFTPYITNYYVFSVVTVFKMMCAGGTDCGANVWILDMWPGKDAWLQALHFSFAVGCALGPLVVEPFLSAGEHTNGQVVGPDSILNWDGKGNALINNENNESRIYIPYGVSGAFSLFAAMLIVFFYHLEKKKRREDRASQQAVQMSPVQSICNAVSLTIPQQQLQQAALNSSQLAIVSGDPQQQTASPNHTNVNATQPQLEPLLTQPPHAAEAPTTIATTTTTTTTTTTATTTNQQQHQPTVGSTTVNDNQQTGKQVSIQLPMPSEWSPSGLANSAANNESSGGSSQKTLEAGAAQQQQNQTVKFTSKATEEKLAGRPPYYVMFAIALAALCLSFYCGIEITSMNYLATFAVNIDLQLPKSTAALMSSALTISFAVGRLFGIWIAAYMRPHKLFYLCSAVMALGNVFILIFANTAERFLWASICLFGIGCGPMYASIVSFYDDKIAKVTNTVSGIFILGSMFNVALNTLIIGHYIIDNALILIVCNLIGAVLLLCLFGSLHALTRIKKNQRKRKFKLQQLRALETVKQQEQRLAAAAAAEAEQQVALLDPTRPPTSHQHHDQESPSPPPPPPPTQLKQ